MNVKTISRLTMYDKFNQKEFSLDFKPGMNILVGSKGGGKSTLLHLLHYLHNKSKLEKPYTEILKENHIEIRSIEYSNGEKILYENLEKSKPSDNDIIKQDDKIKIALSDLAEVKKDNDIFIDSLINENATWFIKLIDEYKNTFSSIEQTRKKYSLNWNLLKNFVAKDEGLTLLKHKLFDSINNKPFDKEKATTYSLLDVYLEKIYEQEPELYQKYKDLLLELKQSHYNKLMNYYIDSKISDNYAQILNDVKRSLNDSNSMDIVVTNFKKGAEALFGELAINLARNNILFKEINNPSLSIKFKGEKKTHYDMVLKIDEEIYLNEISEDDDLWSLSIISMFLYTPKNKRNLWTNWLERFYKDGIQHNFENSTQKINEQLRNRVREYVKLLADGKDYNTMSLGTRTSFGIKQKIKTFKESILFLDQPEDNLDNYTIFHELIKIFNKPDKQYFMVTHNSNFGTLTNPQVITTCSLNKLNPQDSYIQKLDILNEIEIPSEEQIIDSPIRHYLEGGNESLEQRYKKLRKE